MTKSTCNFFYEICARHENNTLSPPVYISRKAKESMFCICFAPLKCVCSQYVSNFFCFFFLIKHKKPFVCDFYWRHLTRTKTGMKRYVCRVHTHNTRVREKIAQLGECVLFIFFRVRGLELFWIKRSLSCAHTLTQNELRYGLRLQQQICVFLFISRNDIEIN